jgi:hypothetical protein
MAPSWLPTTEDQTLFTWFEIASRTTMARVCATVLGFTLYRRECARAQQKIQVVAQRTSNVQAVLPRNGPETAFKT